MLPHSSIDLENNQSTSPPVDPHAPNFHPVNETIPDSELFGELEPKDMEWLCAGGFVTETQTFYTITADGTSLMCQVIHSSVGYDSMADLRTNV